MARSEGISKNSIIQLPITQGQLLQDLGHLADTPAATAILQGTYKFPPGTDKATILVLCAAADIYA